jgi:hypothetical protein
MMNMIIKRMIMETNMIPNIFKMIFNKANPKIIKLIHRTILRTVKSKVSEILLYQKWKHSRLLEYRAYLQLLTNLKKILYSLGFKNY